MKVHELLSNPEPWLRKSVEVEGIVNIISDRGYQDCYLSILPGERLSSVSLNIPYADAATIFEPAFPPATPACPDLPNGQHLVYPATIRATVTQQPDTAAPTLAHITRAQMAIEHDSAFADVIEPAYFTYDAALTYGKFTSADSDKVHQVRVERRLTFDIGPVDESQVIQISPDQPRSLNTIAGRLVTLPGANVGWGAGIKTEALVVGHQPGALDISIITPSKFYFHLLRRYLNDRHPGNPYPQTFAVTGRLVKSFAKRHPYPALIEIKKVVISDGVYLHG
jgi:hypothetical protein